MQDSKDLVEQAARGIEASPTTSPTAAGRTDKKAQANDEQVDTINQVFGLFRLGYHNQFYAAYPDNEQLMQVKRLWLESLSDFPTEQILRGAKLAIEGSEYLPTLHKMLECCHAVIGEYGLPDARSAFREACQAATPKSAQNWSHPAVYLAGRDTDWFFLANNVESFTFPVFKDRYRSYCGRAMAGEDLTVPAPEALPNHLAAPSSKEEALAEIAKIKKSLS